MNRDDQTPYESNSLDTDNSAGESDGSSPEDRESEEADLILERAYWFGNRAGSLSDSTSSLRYLSAVDRAMKTPADPRETLTPARVIEAFHAARKKDVNEAMLFDAWMRPHNLKQDVSAQSSFIGGFGKTLFIESVPSPYSLLTQPVTSEDAPELDLETAAFAYWRTNDEEATIVEAARFFAQDGLLIGRITEPGFYQPIALPDSPLAEPILKLLASIWSELRYYFLTSGLEEAGSITEPVKQTLTSLPDSPAGGSIASFFKPLIEWLSKALPSAIAEPLILKLWRLMRLRVDAWSTLGPIANDDITRIGRVTQIDTHPTNGNTVIAATAGGGVWRTDNAGQCWHPLMENEPTLTMGAVAFAPSNPDIIYAASGEDAGPWNPSWPGAGVYRSDDGGTRWTLTARVCSTRFSAIMVDTHNPYIVYVAGNMGLHKTTDGGRSWITSPGLLSLFDGQVTDVVLAHDEPNRVYIGVYNLGIWRSLTGGQGPDGAPDFELLHLPHLEGSDIGWVKLAIGKHGKYGSNFIVAKVGQVGGTIFTTINGGDSWDKKESIGASAYEEWTSVIAVDPFDDSRLYAGSDLDFLQVSDRQGVEWRDLPSSTAEDQQDIAFDNQNSNRIYLANDSGVYLSENKAEERFDPASKGMSITQVYDLDISEQDEEVVICGAQDTGFYYRNKFCVWKANGADDVMQVAVDPANSEIIYSTRTNDETLSLLRSLDGSNSVCLHSSINLGERSPRVPILKLHPDSSINHPANNRQMFFCGSHTFYHSSNAGQCFQRIDYKMAGPLITDGEITALEYAPGDPTILYLGTFNGVLYKASRGGLVAEDWTRLREEFLRTPIAAIAIDWRNPHYVWVVLAGNGVTRLSRPDQSEHSGERIHVARTSDGGLTWTNASGRIASMSLPDVPMSAIALDPFDRNVAYVGTDVGVFRTSDGGVSWLAFQHGLPRSPVTELRLNRRERILFAATMGRGVYRRRLE